MGLLDLFRTSRPKSAQVAKERLQILVARERTLRHGPSYLQELQRDILAAIQKYVEVDLSAVTVQMEQEEEREILEINIVLPELPKEGRMEASTAEPSVEGGDSSKFASRNGELEGAGGPAEEKKTKRAGRSRRKKRR